VRSRLTIIALSSVLVAAQGRGRPVLSTDPAHDLVRIRAFLTTTAPAVDLTLDGAEWANAISPNPAYRVIIFGPTVRITRSSTGAADIPLEIILAGVPPHGTVGWTIQPAASGGATTFEIDNLNQASPRVVDRFQVGDVAARFTTRADLLRDGGPLGPIPKLRHHLVLAFFYPWWGRDGWSAPFLMDNPVPLSSTEDPVDLRQMMTTAKARGLDAFVMSWAGKDFAGGIDHHRMLRCLDAARAAGFKMAALFESGVANPQHTDGIADPDTVLAWLKDIVDLYASDASYLRVDDRPVVLADGGQRMSQAGWSDVLSRLRSSKRDVLLIGEGINTLRLGAFDGQFYYPSNEFPGTEIQRFDRAQSLNVRTYHLLPSDVVGRRVWAATVSPGYNDSAINDGRVARVVDREGGAYYERQWRAAIDNGADWIVITTWNEYLENTHIEASRLYGDRYLALTEIWRTQFLAANPQAIPRRLTPRDIGGR
jgi:glycosyl hydrolase family 99